MILSLTIICTKRKPNNHLKPTKQTNVFVYILKPCVYLYMPHIEVKTDSFKIVEHL